MFAHERGGAEQAGLFAVREQRDDVVRQRLLARLERTQCLEERHASRAVVGCRRSGFDAVVVDDEQHRLARRARSGQPGENVLHAARFLFARSDGRGRLQLWLDAQRDEPAHDVVAYAIVIRHPDRVRAGRDGLDVVHRALGGEHRVRRGCRDHRRRTRDARDGKGAQGGQTDQRANAKRD